MSSARKITRFISTVGTAATLGLAVYKLVQTIKEAKAIRIQSAKYDRILADAMDSSEAVAKY